jgi:hypothetical protein
MPRCIECNVKFKPKYFLQKFCLENENCIDASVKYALEFNSQKSIEKRHKQIKVNIENSGVFKERLQSKIQEITRLIDKGLPCLATNVIPKQIHGGHVFARGGNSYMAMNLHNIHRQSAQSNHFQNDDGLMKEGIKNEYGEEYLEFISNLRRTPCPEITPLEYGTIYKKACKVANKLIKLNLSYPLKKRIELRNEINLELGIYPSEYCKFEIS